VEIREAADIPTATANTQEEVQVPRATPEQGTGEASILREEPHPGSLFRNLVSCCTDCTQVSDTGCAMTSNRK
jgi:hypothetical protein